MTSRSKPVIDKPRIAITMGDPAGVGPELCLRLLLDAEIRQHCIPLVFGDADILSKVAEAIGLKVHFTSVMDRSVPPNQQRELASIDRIDIGSVSSPDLADLGKVASASVVHVPSLNAAAVAPGVIDANTGQASFDYIDLAIAAASSSLVEGVVTGPINKEAWNAAGIAFPGHTELFADRCKCDRFCMMMYSPNFSCSLVTTHIGYAAVPDELTTERIEEVIELSHEAIRRIEDRAPTVSVLGLNPHAGEHGLFGNHEEERLIEPAINAARDKGISIAGPLPPDTGFLPSRIASTDVYVCMYHDQGLIPFKAFNFDTGVNVTLGLPMVRTSVDHGTANDIAWQGIADPSSLFSATHLAVKLAR